MNVVSFPSIHKTRKISESESKAGKAEDEWCGGQAEVFKRWQKKICGDPFREREEEDFLESENEKR